MNTSDAKAEAVRDAVRRGIEWLVDEDGYDRDSIQEFVDDVIEEAFRLD